MRLFFALAAITGLAAITSPFVFAQEQTEQPAPQKTTAEQSCRGTFGEYRVHCLEGLQEWKG